MQLFDSVTRWISDMPVVRRARNRPRVGVNEPVLMKVVGDDATNAALLCNLSVGGACIRCDLRLSRGDVLLVRVGDGSDEEFEFTASVVAVRPNKLGFFSDFGLRLVELNLESARLLGAFINRRLPDAQAAHRDAQAR